MEIDRILAKPADPWVWFVPFCFLIAVLLIERRPPARPKSDR